MSAPVLKFASRAPSLAERAEQAKAESDAIAAEAVARLTDALSEACDAANLVAGLSIVKPGVRETARQLAIAMQDHAQRITAIQMRSGV